MIINKVFTKPLIWNLECHWARDYPPPTPFLQGLGNFFQNFFLLFAVKSESKQYSFSLMQQWIQFSSRLNLIQANARLLDDGTVLIDVPAMGNWHHSQIIHDFKIMKIIHKDLVNASCAILDLDDTLMGPPSTLREYIDDLQVKYENWMSWNNTFE